MRMAVVAEPILSASDASWIQEIRRENDPNHEVIGPHFTLVFPMALDDSSGFAEDASAVVSRHRAFRGALRRAVPESSPFEPSAYVYLVPDAGASDLVDLHRALYRSTSAHGLRPGSAYTPHITVGRFRSFGEAVRLSSILDTEDLDIPFQIDRVSILRLDQHVPQTIHVAPLRPAGEPSIGAGMNA